MDPRTWPHLVVTHGEFTLAMVQAKLQRTLIELAVVEPHESLTVWVVMSKLTNVDLPVRPYFRADVGFLVLVRRVSLNKFACVPVATEIILIPLKCTPTLR